MQYLLSKQEYDDLLARAKTPEQLAAESAARLKAAQSFLEMLSAETKKVAHSRLVYGDPIGNTSADQVASDAAKAISNAISPFLIACGVDPGQVFNRMGRSSTHSASSA